VGLVSICTPCLLNTPPIFFCRFFFRNVMKLYEFRNDTCFPSVMLWNLTDYVIIPFLAYWMLQNLTDCVTMLLFYFRHVTELHGSCNNALFRLLARYGTSRIVQQWVPSTSKRSSKGCMPSNNGPRTKLGYDRYHNSNDRWKFILLFIRRENGLNKWLKHVKRGYGKQKKMKIKARETSGDH